MQLQKKSFHNNNLLRIHGHSCCEIESKNSSLICDPWLVGSCYWRSWWNFPEPEKLEELIEKWRQKELVIVYITHLHWDHFHAPTLKRISQGLTNAIYLIPRTPETRLSEDMHSVLPGEKIKELYHAKKYFIGDFELLSFQSGIAFADSALAVKSGNDWIWNVNDSKMFKTSANHF